MYRVYYPSWTALEMTTLADLKAAIVRELYNRTDLTTEINAAILSAVAFYEQEKWWWKETQETDLATVNNQPYISLPADFNYEDGFTITYSTYPLPLIKRDWETMLRLLISSVTMRGQPTDYAFYANQIWFYPTPNGNYALTMWKTRDLPVLSDDSQVNNWTTDAEELIRSRAVADIRCHILREQAALMEMGAVAQGGAKQLSNRERIAHENLWTKNTVKLMSGHISPHFF